jgi:biopolymer transport protein ExbB/TolQ
LWLTNLVGSRLARDLGEPSRRKLVRSATKRCFCLADLVSQQRFSYFSRVCGTRGSSCGDPSHPTHQLMDLQDAFLQLALLGANWVLWILVVLSIASVTVAIERWLYFKSIAGADTALLKTVPIKLADDDLEGAAALVKTGTSPGARMLAAMLEVADRGTNSAKAVLEGNRATEKMRLERNLGFLGTVGSNAPFIGLFGTVLEILRVFHLLGEQGVTTGEDASGIMNGISEALVATAIGLLVAIPSVIAYNAFQRRVKRLLSEADALTGTALSQLAEHSKAESGKAS